MNNLSKYLDDLSFIRWIFDSTDDLDLYWQQFMDHHPEEMKNVRQAREIILQFRTVAPKLSDEEKIRLFSRVLKEIEDKEKPLRTNRILINLFKYAAVALIFFSLGMLLFYRQEEQPTPFFYSFNIDGQSPGNQAQLIRSDGQHLFLGTQRSVLKYKKSGELILNKDTLKPVAVGSEETPTLSQLIIPFGKTSEVLFPDGTKVFLNSGSRLAYPEQFVGRFREVLLSGEAYFEVSHDKRHPFIVQTSNLQITDLGTRFNISAYTSDKRVEAVLTEGKISISKRNSKLFSRTIDLAPGQMASYNRETDQTTVSLVNTSNYILWTQGMMKFESTDLNRILKKVERYFNIHFSYEDPDLGEMKISGKLGLNEGKDEVIERIARTASIKILKKEEGLYEVTK